jgi:hypothetical protein
MAPLHLFVDTNVLLNFYSFADDDLGQLERLIVAIHDNDVCLHLPEQVMNELARNRETKLKAATDQFNKEPLPTAVPRHMQAYAQHAEYVAVIEQAKKLRNQLVSLALADASNQTLKIDALLRSLFEEASKYAEDNVVFALALQRMQKANPPGKNGSVGDQYNWEVLLRQVPSGDLHIVSRDGDYASLLNKSRPHPSLEVEWKGKKEGLLHIYPDLRSFLKRYHETMAQLDIDRPLPPAPQVMPVEAAPEVVVVHVAPAAEARADAILDPIKEEAIQNLIDSGSFSTTHAAIARLNLLKHTLNKSDAERLINAAVNNDQVKWIATDSDVYTFFVSLFTEYSDIRPDLFEMAVDVFGLRPEPNDPFDD